MVNKERVDIVEARMRAIDANYGDYVLHSYILIRDTMAEYGINKKEAILIFNAAMNIVK